MMQKRKIALGVSVPAIAALGFATPALADSSSTPSSATITHEAEAFSGTQLSSLTVSEIQAAYQDALTGKTAAVTKLDGAVRSLDSTVGGASTVSKSEHADAVALGRIDAGLQHALAAIPATGLLAASPAEIAQVHALSAELKALAASLSDVATLPTTPAATTPTTATPASFTTKAKDVADPTHMCNHMGMKVSFNDHRGHDGAGAQAAAFHGSPRGGFRHSA